MNFTGASSAFWFAAGPFGVRGWIARLVRRGGGEGSRGPAVLAVVEEGPARAAVVEAARQSRWVLDVADSLSSALETQRAKRHAVVVYQRELPGDDWRWAVSRCAGMAGQPCVILLSRLTDHNLWMELARNGGSDLLREPVEVPALGAAVQNAWSLWKTQQKLRRRADHRRQQRPS